MPEPLLPLYNDYVEASNGLLAAQSKFDSAKAALFAVMPEEVEFATEPIHAPMAKRVGDQIVTVFKPFLGDPYEAGA